MLEDRSEAGYIYVALKEQVACPALQVDNITRCRIIELDNGEGPGHSGVVQITPEGA